MVGFPATGGRCRGYSLIELMAAVAVSLIVLVFLLQMLGFSSNQWRSTTENARAFQSARAAFESISRSLSQATLSVEYDYYNAARQSRSQIAASGTAALENFVPDVYGRSSRLHFISGRNLVNNQHTHAIFFQAPFDFAETSSTEPDSGQLNAVGFFVRYGSDANDRPPNIPSSNPPPRNRFRLMQYLQPTSGLDVYRDATGTAWFTNDVNKSQPVNCHVLAENVVALVFLPKRSDDQENSGAIAPGYRYDSRTPWTGGRQPVQMHQLPPVVRVVMVAIDEVSAMRNPTLGEEFKNLFHNPEDLEKDLETVEQMLRNKRVNYRIFQSDVPIRTAKWSE